jgi:mRNA interferase HicA
MKRTELIRKIKLVGCILIRHGGKHDWYQNPNTKISQPVPRHRDIADSLANHILKILSD